MGSHVNLRVWQLANAFASRIFVVTKGRPLYEAPDIVRQIRRASYSVPFNLAEGRAAGTHRQYRRSISIAIAEAAEVDAQIVALMELEFLSPARSFALRNELATIRRQLLALKRAIPED